MSQAWALNFQWGCGVSQWDRAHTAKTGSTKSARRVYNPPLRLWRKCSRKKKKKNRLEDVSRCRSAHAVSPWMPVIPTPPIKTWLYIRWQPCLGTFCDMCRLYCCRKYCRQGLSWLCMNSASTIITFRENCIKEILESFVITIQGSCIHSSCCQCVVEVMECQYRY